MALKVSTVYKETIPTISSAIIIVLKWSIYLNDQADKVRKRFFWTTF